MVVVDTNVLAYLLIAGDRTRDAQALLSRDPDWRSEAFLLVEFSNLLATYVRAGALGRSQALSLLAAAESRMRGLVNVPHARALSVAAELSVSAYDARFIAAAQVLGARLVTEDAKLRDAAPALTLSLAAALAGS
jgi:predicted nucleic acid-binding protein